ncbi:MAG: outer membrane beta-barrel protein [Vicinamibacterales bacterium]
MQKLAGLTLAAVLINAAPVFAQARVPDSQMMAVGVDAGILFPGDQLEPGPIVNGLWEYYLTPRVGVRTTLGWANPAFERNEEDSQRQIKLALDLLYNWEYGKVHPFVSGGAGVWFLQPKENGENFGESENKSGLTFGAGIDYFVTRTAALKFEGRYDWVAVDDGRPDPSGISLTAGVKKFF